MMPREKEEEGSRHRSPLARASVRCHFSNSKEEEESEKKNAECCQSSPRTRSTGEQTSYEESCERSGKEDFETERQDQKLRSEYREEIPIHANQSVSEKTDQRKARQLETPQRETEEENRSSSILQQKVFRGWEEVIEGEEEKVPSPLSFFILCK